MNDSIKPAQYNAIPDGGNPQMSGAWQHLAEHAERLQGQHLANLFAADAQRHQHFSVMQGPLLLDFSKQRVDQPVMQALASLADAAELRDWTRRLFSAEPVNNTENRAAMHWALRAPADTEFADPQPGLFAGVQAQLGRMQQIVEKVHAGQWRGVTGEAITDVVNIGVGGSDLGPLMVSRALGEVDDEQHKLGIHFASSMDGSQMAQLLHDLRPHKTLFIISSKSFTTVDTLSNADTARAWLERSLGASQALMHCHFIGVSSAADKMADWGILPENQLRIWDWVGGRYSLWSCIGLPIALRIGMPGFRRLLAGAWWMDEHFRNAPWLENIPVLMALIGVWNTNCLGINAHAILPYDGRLEKLPAYLEQLEMESNGKSVTRDGQQVQQHTCPVLWGEVGPNAQHAFYQLLHQGTEVVTCDFIAPALRYQAEAEAGSDELIRQHELALANCFAQSRLLALGEAALDNPEELPAWKHYRGNQPSTTLLLRELSPFSMGAMIAAYEHKVFAQSVIWGINPFDQWGVEMGKKIANQTLGVIRSGTQDPSLDSSTKGLIDFVRGQ
ncbi:glucose-6-phosphate isomerase [Halopseudomonas salegens]|uniref:Glucose-6-phosphate isomerase n=1 Tax=Halopseudomonas salegens TaxID=1434072 RepID=A0A1H2FLK8_9GAMM|nr:glucose-6-phosphate isomerase [Halopseudomonas salegens]SDU07818.1 glucose-6-phosphate isomerase [Halopseudomonas salegens]